LETVRAKYKGAQGWAEPASVRVLEGIEGILKAIEDRDGKAFLESYKRLVWAEWHLRHYITIEEHRQLREHMGRLTDELVRQLRDVCGCKWQAGAGVESVERRIIDELREVEDLLVEISSKYRDRAGWAGVYAQRMLVAVREMMLGIENRDTETILKWYEDIRTNAKELTEVIKQEEGEVLKGHMERLRELLGSHRGECEKYERELTVVRVDELTPTMAFLDEIRPK